MTKRSPESRHPPAAVSRCSVPQESTVNPQAFQGLFSFLQTCLQGREGGERREAEKHLYMLVSPTMPTPRAVPEPFPQGTIT